MHRDSLAQANNVYQLSALNLDDHKDLKFYHVMELVAHMDAKKDTNRLAVMPNKHVTGVVNGHLIV